MASRSAVVLFGALGLCLTSLVTSGAEALQPGGRPPITREVFDRRLAAWREFIETSGIGGCSVAEPYMNNKPYHDLVALGPVAIPWFVEKHSPFASAAWSSWLRARWPDYPGFLTRPESAEADHYAAFAEWWQQATRTASAKFDRHNAGFRTMLENTRMTDTAKMRATEEWQRLRFIGLLGVPSVMDRIESGVADEWDYRLITWWTAPVVYMEGVPGLPPEPAELPPEKKTREYWLNWWERNKWQFWWLIPGGKEPK